MRRRRRAPAPGSRRPRGRTGPIETSSVQRWSRIRWSKPSKRAERSVSAGSPASSSTSSWSSWRPPRRQRDTRARDPAVHGIERRRDDVHPEHHPRPTPVRLVVDLAGAERRRVAVVEDAQLELVPEHRRHGPALADPLERAGNQREDVDAHDSSEVTRRPRSRARRATLPAVEVDLEDALLDERQEQAGVELEGVVRGPGQHVVHQPEARPALLEHLEPEEIGDVERPVLELRRGLHAARRAGAALDRPVEADRAPALADATGGDDGRRRAVDEDRRAHGEPARVAARPLDDERPVGPVRAPPGRS